MFNVSSIYVHHLQLEVTEIVVTMLNSVKKKKKKIMCISFVSVINREGSNISLIWYNDKA